MAESELHKTIKMKAVEYLANKGYHVARHEVRDGWYGIIDAWGIRPNNCYSMGIEVKVSRSDWRAAKWKDYKTESERSQKHPFGYTGTNELYYACPTGLIQPNEVSESVGLLWYNANGRFVNKKKPYFLKVSAQVKMQTLLSIYEPFFAVY
ncbi:MAG TPA: hypothetical protein VF596_18490 [Pyrinomonadaceae bacterium]|jgi:hypothetical protein